MTMLRKLTLVVFFFGLAGIAGADTLDMKDTDANNASVGPKSGTTQSNVEATFGSPKAKVAPVGDPPITRWEYDGFVVYFEYDRVIHTVKKR